MSAVRKFQPVAQKPWDDPTERAMVYTFTPEDAAYLLSERNTANRPHSDSQVEFIKQEILGGYWRRNGETIIFDSQGKVRNGQHRLIACVESRMPIETWCVFGIDPETFRTMDRTRRRNNADDLAIAGEKNWHCLAATLAMLQLEEAGRLEQVGAPVLNRHEAIGMLEKHPRVRGAVSYAASHKPVSSLLPPRVVAFCLYRFSEIDHDAGYEFFDRFGSGEMLEADSPILLLRNRMSENRASKAKLSVKEVLALTIKAWSAWRAGQKLRYLRWRAEGPAAEAFPVPI